MINLINYIDTKKKELGLEHMTDNEILKYSLQCSQEIKNELSNQNNKVGNYKLIKMCIRDRLQL